MLAVMHHSPANQVGRGTGYVLLGFLLGYGVGAPLLACQLILANSYTAGWLGVAVLFLAATEVARRIHFAEVA